MRKFAVLILALTISLSSFGQSLLKDGYKIIPSEGGSIVGFKQNGKIGFVLNSSSFPIVIKPMFDDMYNENFAMCDNMVRVKKNGKWGAVDATLNVASEDKLRIPCMYDKISSFKNGVAVAILNGKKVKIDMDNNIIQ